jgi:hypothetical protein
MSTDFCDLKSGNGDFELIQRLIKLFMRGYAADYRKSKLCSLIILFIL